MPSLGWRFRSMNGSLKKKGTGYFFYRDCLRMGTVPFLPEKAACPFFCIFSEGELPILFQKKLPVPFSSFRNDAKNFFDYLAPLGHLSTCHAQASSQ